MPNSAVCYHVDLPVPKVEQMDHPVVGGLFLVHMDGRHPGPVKGRRHHRKFYGGNVVVKVLSLYFLEKDDPVQFFGFQPGKEFLFA
jgi:hypothetical protein